MKQRKRRQNGNTQRKVGYLSASVEDIRTGFRRLEKKLDGMFLNGFPMCREHQTAIAELRDDIRQTKTVTVPGVGLPIPRAVVTGVVRAIIIVFLGFISFQKPAEIRVPVPASVSESDVALRPLLQKLLKALEDWGDPVAGGAVKP